MDPETGLPPELREEESSAQQVSAKGVLLGLGKFAIAGVILWWLYHKGDLKPERLAAALAHWRVCLLVFAITMLAAYTQGYRWIWLLKSRDIDMSLWNAFRYLMEGKFFNLIIPGYFSEDFLRGLYAIRTHKESRSKVIASLMVDRISGVFTMLLFGAVGLLIRPGTLEHPALRGLFFVCAGLVGVSFAGVVFLRVVTRPPEFVLSLARRLHLHVAIESMYAEGHFYAANTPLLVLTVLISLANQGSMILCYGLLGGALGMSDVTWLDYTIFVPAGTLATMLPIGPVGLGVGNVAFDALFRLAHSQGGANLFLLYTLMVVLLSLCGGGFYLSNRGNSKKS